jgi:hypothetical protein
LQIQLLQFNVVEEFSSGTKDGVEMIETLN